MRSKQAQSKSKGKISEISAGAVVFHIENKTIKVLLLVQRDNSDFYDVPKGHVEKGESVFRAAHREIQEEIGLSLHMDTNFRYEMVYDIRIQNKKTRKFVKGNKMVVLFLAFLTAHDRKRIVLSEEHVKYLFMPIDEAIEKVKYPNQKELLTKAKAYITKNYLVKQ